MVIFLTRSSLSDEFPMLNKGDFTLGGMLAECRGDIAFLKCRFRLKVEIISRSPLRTNVALFLNQSFLCIHVNKVSHYKMVYSRFTINLKVKWLRASTLKTVKYQKSF